MITSPKAGAAIYSPAGFDAARVLLAAGADPDAAILYWYADGAFLGAAESARRSNGLPLPVRMNSPLWMISGARARCGLRSDAGNHENLARPAVCGPRVWKNRLPQGLTLFYKFLCLTSAFPH